ncbi:uncharacterized conserved protein DUF2293 [Aspergillus terreus]|uniref:Uncharacterized conserved protein DUF2293 n=1 Tax=Aspergillus terreus TaxID=33178 RepID=A0A5M3Z0W1_ASPTE|nr:hypothetical protein ATETN484_0007019700 [Aspergillus terreus]GFF16002.1 uncharacterized conserved protein DUF2293 [Aspergillus terreus]
MAAANRSSRKKISNSPVGRRKSRTRPRFSPRSLQSLRSPQPRKNSLAPRGGRGTGRRSPFGRISKPAGNRSKRNWNPPKFSVLPASNDPLEKSCFERQPIPEGYIFVPKGDVYITRHCRVKTKESQRTVYAVYDKSGKRPLGLRVPSDIYATVSQSAAATADSRANAVKLRDERELAHSRQLLRTQFPLMPEDSLEIILNHAFLKGSGRVGRTATKSDAQKANLAVEAYIRHNHTPYEALLNHGHARTEARNAVWNTVRSIKAAWEGDSVEPMGLVTLRSRKPPGLDMEPPDQVCLIS